MRFAALLLMLSCAWTQSADPPPFAQFAVTETFSSKSAAPVLRTARQRTFRTRIREGAAKGVNFAGHFTIADWGCGAGCVSMVVIDAKDGHVYDGPFDVLAWEPYQYEGKILSNTPEFAPLDFRKDSRLLVARGCPGEKDCASYFYEWAPPTFKLVRKVEGKALPQ